MKMHIIFVSLACVSMVCVTAPVEASPKEARHTSMQTRAFWNDIISSLSRMYACMYEYVSPRLLEYVLHYPTTSTLSTLD